MNYFRNRWLTILACAILIIAVGVGIVLHTNYDMPQSTITACLGGAAVLAAILIIVDAVVFRKMLAEENEKDLELEALYSDLEHSKERIIDLTESNERAGANLRNAEDVISQLKREKHIGLEQIEILKRQIDELNAVKAFGADVSNINVSTESSADNKDIEVYRDTIGQWTVDTINSVRAVKKYADSHDDKELSKNSEIIFGNLEKILYFTNIDKLDGQVEMSNCALTNVVKEVLKKYTYIFNEKKIGIFRKGLESVVVTNKVWLAYGFSQVLYNALHSTGEFGKISIIAKEDDENVYLTVEDSSMGIREEEMADIFKPGFVSSEAKRISDNTTSTCFYLAKKAFEKIDGQLSVESKYGMGTKVTMTMKKAEPKA